MKKQLSGFILSAFLLITIVSFGQTKNYSIKKINDIEYYQYTVQVSEGLFAIGRKFEVSPDDISKANPEIINGLKVGQQILIPVQKKAIQTNKPEIKVKQEFIEHKVEKKQTLFAISRKYNVSQEDITKYNPDIKSGLRDGIVLRIPVQANENNKKEIEKTVVEKSIKISTTQPKDEKKTTIHVVLPYETLYSISRLYKVDVAEIKELNPEYLTKLPVGTELKIPVNTVNAPVGKKDTVGNTTKLESDINRLSDTNESTAPTEKSKVIRIAFLLPFMLDQEKKDPSTDRFLDFYAGSLIAVKEAKEKGISFEIHSYDTEKSEEKLTEVLSNSELKTMDLIIGPTFSNQVSLIGDFAKENKINTLIPFTSKVADIDTNPYLFQFNPGADTQLNFATELFTGKYKNWHLVFAQIPGISSMDEGKIWADDLKKELKKANKSYSTLELTTSDMADFGSVLKSGEKNLIIFNTDKYAYVSPFISSLRTVSTEYNVVLFEQFSWRNQSEKLPNGLCLSPFVTQVNSENLDSYNKEFTYFYGKAISKESPRYDLLGYDLSSYFISLFHQYGKKFTDKIGSFHFTDGLQSKPLFERSSNGSGFINQRIYLIED